MAPVSDGIPEVAVVIGRTRTLGAAAWALTVLAALVLLLLDPVDGAPDVSAWIVWITLTVAAGFALLPLGHPLTPRAAWLAAGLAVAAAVAPFFDHPSEESGFAPWYVRTGTTVFIILIIRARPVAAWTGAVLAYAVLLAWAVEAGEVLGPWVISVLRQIAAMAGFQIFAVAVAWAGRSILAYRSAEHERVREEARRDAAGRERGAVLGRIRELADPVLRRLATGEDSRAAAEFAEAEVRDLLRGRRLAAEPVTTAVRVARHRGSEVILLDDLPDGDGASEEDLAETRVRVAELLERDLGRRVTVRVSRVDASRIRVTAVGDGPVTELTMPVASPPGTR